MSMKGSKAGELEEKTQNSGAGPGEAYGWRSRTAVSKARKPRAWRRALMVENPQATRLRIQGPGSEVWGLKAES